MEGVCYVMSDLKINKVPPDVLESLAIIARKKGYKSRDAFLRDELEKIVQAYWKTDNDLEQILVTKALKVIELNTDVLQKLLDKKIVANPFDVV